MVECTGLENRRGSHLPGFESLGLHHPEVLGDGDEVEEVDRILEILVGIPTVVFGFFAITFMTPVLRSIFGTRVVGFFNVPSAAIVVPILIIPLVPFRPSNPQVL